jgi:hypothetical protein
MNASPVWHRKPSSCTPSREHEHAAQLWNEHEHQPSQARYRKPSFHTGLACVYICTRVASEILRNLRFCGSLNLAEIARNFDLVKGVKFSEIGLSLPRPTVHCHLITAHCPLPTVYCPLSTACLLSSTQCLMPNVQCPLSITCYLLPTIYFQLLTAFCSLPNVYCPLFTAHCLPPTVYSVLSTVYCSLSTTHCLLPTVQCPLSSGYSTLSTARCPLSMLFICCIFGSISFLTRQLLMGSVQWSMDSGQCVADKRTVRVGSIH